MSDASPRIQVEDLAVIRPDGRPLFRASFTVAAGQIVALLGPSGSGKTTLLRALTDRRGLERERFTVEARRAEVSGAAAIVPQGGAPFDHVSVRGNLALVLRNRRPPAPSDARAVAEWLGRVDLPASLATGRTAVATLSGGMVQRLCLARALASGREILVLDEPSTGLDLARVEDLAAELRKQAGSAGVAVILVTHDTLLAALAADQVHLLGMSDGGFETLALASPGAVPADTRREAIEQALRSHAAPPTQPASRKPPATPGWARLGDWAFGPMRQPAISLAGIVESLRSPVRDRLEVMRHAYRLAVLSPLAFYAVVSCLLGFTLLYVISASAPNGIAPATAIRMLGGAYVVALTPPLSALLFVACSGSTLNAWLGTLGLTGQVEALRSLGIQPRRYLWGPAFECLVLSFLAVGLTVGTGLLGGGLALGWMVGLEHGWQVLGEDLLYPRPERVANLTRALCLLGLYAFGIASEVVWRASRPMHTSHEIPQAMTRSVIRVTLWVVAWELITALWLFNPRW